MLPFTEQFIVQGALAPTLPLTCKNRDGPLWKYICDEIYYECYIAFKEYIKQLKLKSTMIIGDITQYNTPQKEVFGIIVNLDTETLELQFYREHMIRLVKGSFLIIPIHPLFSFRLSHPRSHLYIPISLSE